MVFSLGTNFNLFVSAQDDTKEIKVNTKSQTELRKSLRQASKNDPNKIETQKLKNKSKDNLETQSIGDTNINLDLKTKKIKIKNKSKGDINIGIPNSNKINSVDVVDDKVIYTTSDNKVETIVEAMEGGMRQVINIKDNTAPSFYDFPVELNAGEIIQINEDGTASINTPFTPEEQKQNQELLKTAPIDFKLPKNKAKLSIAKPWAKDNNGKDLPTSYSVNGNNLRQTIDFTGAVFPVTADPIWCGNAINSVSWIYRDNLYSASISPTNCGAYNSINNWNAWQEAVDKTPLFCSTYSGKTCIKYEWNKNYGTSVYWSMYDQFVCHTEYAKGWKPIWNLEPARRNWGYLDTVKYSCNPPKV